MEALRRFRRQLGLTQQELADKAGVSQYTITEIETGRREARPSTLRKLANALDVEVADFFREPRPVRLSGSSAAKSDARATVTVRVSRQLLEHLVDIAEEHEPLESEEQREVDEVLQRI